MDVKLAHPSKTRIIAENKNDSLDAKMLAHLLREKPYSRIVSLQKK